MYISETNLSTEKQFNQSQLREAAIKFIKDSNGTGLAHLVFSDKTEYPTTQFEVGKRLVCAMILECYINYFSANYNVIDNGSQLVSKIINYSKLNKISDITSLNVFSTVLAGKVINCFMKLNTEGETTLKVL